VVTLQGEDGTVIDSGSRHNNGLSLAGQTVVDNVDVAGGWPFVYIGGTNSTWQGSRMLRGRQPRNLGDAEPVLIYDDSGFVRDATVRDVVIEGQPAAPGYHLEQVRIDQNVDGVTLDRVTFGACPDCGSGHVFITTPNTTTFDPTRVTIRNSVFEGSANYAIQIHQNVNIANWTYAYNTFRQEAQYGESSRSNFLVVGNAGTRPQMCLSGVTWTRNVWQWAVGNPCGTDKLVTGNSFSISALGLDAALRPTAGSPVIDTGETSYCTGPLGGISRDGRSRTAPCDAGAFER
jgi:hypothetical protein